MGHILVSVIVGVLVCSVVLELDSQVLSCSISIPDVMPVYMALLENEVSGFASSICFLSFKCMKLHKTYFCLYYECLSSCFV